MMDPAVRDIRLKNDILLVNMDQEIDHIVNVVEPRENPQNHLSVSSSSSNPWMITMNYYI